MRNPVSGLIEAIVAGYAVDGRLAPEATVDTPLRGPQGFSDWAVDERSWLIEGATTVRAINHLRRRVAAARTLCIAGAG